MVEPSSVRLRVVTLVAIVVNIAFSYSIDLLGASGQSVAAVSAQHHNAFTPAGYAFAIWGLIYLAFLIYGIAQFSPAARRQPGIDAISSMVLAVNLLAMSWIAVFRQDAIALSTAIISGMLAAGIAMYVFAFEMVREGASPAWMLPSSLFLGWISVAVIANVAALLVAHGFHGGILGEAPWAMAMLVAASTLGAAISLRFGDFVFPMVIAWAAVAIGVETHEPSGKLALCAFTCAGAETVLAAAVATSLLGDRRAHARWSAPSSCQPQTPGRRAQRRSARTSSACPSAW